MEKFDVNYDGAVKPAVSGGAPMEGVKFGTEATADGRRVVLKDIRNINGAVGLNHCPLGKKDLSRKDVVDDKNSKRFIGHRPITRRSFAASLANQSELTQGSARYGAIECEQQQKSFASGSISNDHSLIAIDVDGFQPTDNFPLPVTKEIEGMINCELKEVEMEEIEEERLQDIVSCDANNPLPVVEYVEDIYNFYRETEDAGCVPHDYMLNQSDINEKMRAILIDWLIEVHCKFELMDETLFLTVNVIDRFLSCQTVARKKLQLVGVTAMLLACKYEEVSVPVVEDLILITDRAYTRAEVLEMESLMVNALQFNMSVPTPYVFMQRFLKAAESDKKLELLSFFLIELCLVEYQMRKFRPSLLAAAAVYTAQCTLKGFQYWSKPSEHQSQYSENQLLECSRMMVEFHQKAAEGKLSAVLRKYSTSRFGFAAKSEPASFLLNA